MATLSIRLTDAAKADLEQRSIKAGMSLSAYVLKAALGAKPGAASSLAAHDLARIALRLQRHAPDEPIIAAIRLILTQL